MHGVPPMRSSDPNRNPWSSPSIDRDGHQRELLDVPVELLVLQRQADAGDQLTELIELGRLQRDGITRLDVHRVTILADGAPRGPVGPQSARLTRRSRPSRPGSGLGDLGGRARSNTSTQQRGHGDVAHPLVVGRHDVPRRPVGGRGGDRRVRSARGTRPTGARTSRSARRNFQFFSGSSMRACRRARCSSFEMWRNTFTTVVPSSREHPLELADVAVPPLAAGRRRRRRCMRAATTSS